MQYTLT